MFTAKKRIVICGGGIMGTSVAYYLSLLNQASEEHSQDLEIVLVERTSIACSASGKSGGFLAREWCNSLPIENLARKSFDLHKQLAFELDGENTYGYRKVETLSASVNFDKNTHFSSKPNDWLQDNCETSFLSNEESTAQVNPYFLTNKLLEQSLKKGVKLVYGSLTGLSFSEDDTKIDHVLIDGKYVKCDIVVIAMGAWSFEINSYLAHNKPKIPIHGVKAHSIVYTPRNYDIPNYKPQVFFVHYTKNRITKEIEIYPKSGGELYVCGESQNIDIPSSADLILPDNRSIENLIEVSNKIIKDVPTKYELKTGQACYLPCTLVDVPLIGAYPGYNNMLLACGHSCWGILNGPATGLAIAELILKGEATSVDIRSCDPSSVLL